MLLLKLNRWDVADRLQQSAVVEPIHSLEGREFHVFEVAPGTSRSDDLGFEESDNRFGQRVVVGVTDAAHRGLDAGFGETLGVVDRDVL